MKKRKSSKKGHKCCGVPRTLRAAKRNKINFEIHSLEAEAMLTTNQGSSDWITFGGKPKIGALARIRIASVTPAIEKGKITVCYYVSKTEVACADMTREELDRMLA